ncbi:MAG: DUF512 domain-containing protein [Clostridia bacterium]
MPITITNVEKGSIADKHGILKGDVLLSINGNEITDILDYRFYETEKDLLLGIIKNGENTDVSLKKSRYSGIGLEFETYLMDKEKTCKNKCVFCFIDQLPKGMRESLYFKDDDERLSFLFGNYVTLTNMNEKDIDRIIKMHISPINVSVHTMNPELRNKMMGNRFAGEKLAYLKKLSDAGIMLNTQLVLCPDINDSKELEYSLTELLKLGESLQSIACVPVGLTAHRQGLFKLLPFTKKTAGDVIDIIEKFGDISLEKTGQRKIFPSDEFYIIAKRELPDYDFYEDFPQIENGVGMFRNLEEELIFATEENDEKVKDKKVGIITGTAIQPLLNNLLDIVREKWNNINIDLIAVKNEFFGGGVDVTGLITGSDIIRTIGKKPDYDILLIPEVCLKADEDIFLDDIKLLDLEKIVATKKVGSTGEELLNAILY